MDKIDSKNERSSYICGERHCKHSTSCFHDAEDDLGFLCYRTADPERGVEKIIPYAKDGKKCHSCIYGVYFNNKKEWLCNAGLSDEEGFCENHYIQEK